MTQKIERCPFCQCEPKQLSGFTSTEDQESGWWLECPTPDCLIAPMALTEDAAIRHWNRIARGMALAAAVESAAPAALRGGA